LYFMYVKLKE